MTTVQQTGSIDLAAQNGAAKTATNYITADSSGIKIHDANDNSNYQHLTSDGTEIYKSGNSVAAFGNTTRIGKSNDLHMNLSNGGIRLYEKEETPYADSSTAKFTTNQSVIGNVTDIHSKISSDGFQLLVGEDKLFSIDTEQKITTHSQNDGWEVKLFVFDEVFGEGTITTSTNGYITSNGNVHDSGQGDGWCWIASSILRAKPQLFFDIAEQTYDTQREWVPVEELIDNEFLTYEYTEPEVYGTSDTYRFYFKVSNIDTEYLPLRWKMGIGHYNYDLNIQVGRENESHMKLDYHSLQMIDKDGETYFHISDLRDAEGRITDVFEGDGSTTVFTTSMPFNGSPIVKVNGTTFTNYTIDSVIVNRLIFGTAPANGSEITIKYEPTMNHTKAYTLGKRDESAYVGLYSVAEGYNVAVSGLYSHAEGYNTKARFAYSHAEGYYTEATASSTHAEGYRTIASGEYSHASGCRTKASSRSQTVIGEYNVEDYAQIHQSGKYAFIIGNGTADNARSNALAVDWNGGIYSQAMAGVIQMFAGSTAPSGWLVCDGSAVSRTTYATLFAAIGTTWGTGDGSTTFNLPDLRGRAPIGAGTGSGLTARTLGSTGGSEALQSHDHAAASNGYNVPGKDGGWNWRQTNSGSSTNYKNTPMGGSTASVANITRTGSAGSGNAGNMQPFAVINFIICTGKTS